MKNVFARSIASCIVVVASTLLCANAQASVLFEGFTKLILQGQHVGYIVQRYEFDEKKKHFVVRQFLHAEGNGLSIRESLHARCTSGFEPVSYQYTEQKGDQVKLIDIKFKGKKMTGNIQRGEKKKLSKEIVSREIPKGTFLASFLYYLMLTGKDGIKKGVKYDYAAIAEEDANISKGSAYVAAEETVAGVPAFKVLNKFKDAEYVSYVTGKAETIITRNTSQSIETLLVADPQEAIRGMAVNTNTLKELFGSFPAGKTNPLNAKGTKEKLVTQTESESPPLTKDAQPKIDSGGKDK